MTILLKKTRPWGPRVWAFKCACCVSRSFLNIPRSACTTRSVCNNRGTVSEARDETWKIYICHEHWCVPRARRIREHILLVPFLPTPSPATTPRSCVLFVLPSALFPRTSLLTPTRVRTTRTNQYRMHLRARGFWGVARSSPVSPTLRFTLDTPSPSENVINTLIRERTVRCTRGISSLLLEPAISVAARRPSAAYT